MALNIISDLLSTLGLGDVAGMVGLGPNPGMEGMQKAMEDARKSYDAYRPEMWAARQGALQHTMDLFQPVNTKMAEMYGQDATVPLSAAFDYDYSTPSPGAMAAAHAPAAEPKGPIGIDPSMFAPTYNNPDLRGQTGKPNPPASTYGGTDLRGQTGKPNPPAPIFGNADTRGAKPVPAAPQRRGR